MTYVVARKTGGYELRESLATERGPRSRTLASFRELTPEAVERGLARARTSLDASQVHEAARRAGAPIKAGAGSAAAQLVGELRPSAQLAPGLRRALLDGLGVELREPLSASERAAAQWLGQSPRRRGEALRDLLSLTDRLPARRGADRLRFPRIDSTQT